MRIKNIFLIGAEENPVLPFIHSYSRMGINIFVGSYKRFCTGCLSYYPKRRLVYPSPFKDEKKFIKEILKIIIRFNIDFVYVFGEYNSFIVTKYKPLIEKYATLPINNMATYMMAKDKKNTVKAAIEAGVPVPKTWFPDEEPIEYIAKKVKYPVVIKPRISYGARGISYPGSERELINKYYKTKEKFGECIIQEYIPPGGGQFKAEIFLDNSLNLIGSCVYEKIRYYPPTGGSSTFNMTLKRNDITLYAYEILRRINWVGLGDCDFIVDPRDKIPKLLEINPRTTRSIKICYLAGIDFPKLVLKLGIEQPIVNKYNAKEGVYMRYLIPDLLWFFKAKKPFKERIVFIKQLLMPIKEETFELSDPFPLLGYIISNISQIKNKLHR